MVVVDRRPDIRNVKSIAIAAAAFLGLGSGLHGPAVASAAVGLELIAQVESATYLWNAGDDRLFIVERAGRILIYRPGEGLLPTPFLDISDRVLVNGERGLWSMAFHPDFASNGLFYVAYAGNQPLTGVILARYQVSAGAPDVADPASEVIVYAAHHPSGAHNGGQIAVRPTDHDLYLSVGDGGSSNDPPCNAQNPQVPLGKMLRLDVSQNLDTPPYHAIPADNPFVGAADPGDEVLDEIWSLGLRNPFRFSFDRSTGDLFIGDVGQDAREETDFEPAGSAGGANFGWKVMEGTLLPEPGRGELSRRNAALLRPGLHRADPRGATHRERDLRRHRRLSLSRQRDPRARGQVRLRRPLQRSNLVARGGDTRDVGQPSASRRGGALPPVVRGGRRW